MIIRYFIFKELKNFKFQILLFQNHGSESKTTSGKSMKKDRLDWYYLGRHNGFCSVGLTVLIPQKLRVYDH